MPAEIKWLSAVNIMIAVLSVLIGAIAGYLTHRGVTSQERSRKQQYFSELRHWADEAVNMLSEAVHLCELDPTKCLEPSFYNRRHNLKAAFSSLIDRGRWFFPNLKSTDYGSWKAEAFSGFRHPVLDNLVYAYGAVRNMNYEDKEKNMFLKEPLVEVKKNFVSEIQRKLDPRKTQKEFVAAMQQQDKEMHNIGVEQTRRN